MTAGHETPATRVDSADQPAGKNLVRQRSITDDPNQVGEKRPRTTAIIEIDVDGMFTTPTGRHHLSEIQ